jgi:tripartite ATP-independent transporter DctM subunit
MKEGIERAVDLVGRAASWLALVIVAVMATNVVLRYLFSYGSVWAQELEWHLLAPLILFGIPYALLKGEHVRVDVLYAKFSEKNQLRVEVVSQFLCILIAAAFVWLWLGRPRRAALPLGPQGADPRRVRAPRPAERGHPVGRDRQAAPAPGCAMSGQEILALCMLGSFFVLLMAGVPVAITLATVGFGFGALGFGTGLFNLLPSRIYGVVANYQWLAIPLFVFMGVMLEKSRLADDLLDVVGHLAGGLRGGMALGIIGVGVLMGATTGIVGATVITLGLLTLPTLLKRGYDPGIACGAICASGTLGQIIPPSLILILLADILQLSVGTLFAAAVMPGMLLAALYCVYIVIVGMVKPHLVPPLPQDERDALARRDLWIRFFKVVVPPVLLVFAVLGSIIGGVAAPTEAASMGALGSIIVTAFAGRMSMKVLRDVVQSVTKITAMMMFILVCAQVFSLSFRGLHGEDIISRMFEWLPGGVAADIWFLMLLIFVLGFFLEWIEISYIAVPLFLPVFVSQGVDLVWLAMLICVNLQTSFLTPPFGWALFFLKGVAPPEVSTRQIYLGVLPFIALQVVAVVLVFLFPQIALWLPKTIGW